MQISSKSKITRRYFLGALAAGSAAVALAGSPIPAITKATLMPEPLPPPPSTP